MDGTLLDVAVDAARVRRRNAGGFVHLHLLDEVLRLASTFVSDFRVFVQDESGQSEEEHGNDREGERPGDDVELRVHQPVATVSVDAEDEHADEKENRRHRHSDEGHRGQQPLVAQHELQRVAAHLARHDAQRSERVDEGERYEALHRHQPAGQQIFADHVIFLGKKGFKIISNGTPRPDSHD